MGEFPGFPESFWNLFSWVTTFKSNSMGLYVISLLAATNEFFLLLSILLLFCFLPSYYCSSH